MLTFVPLSVMFESTMWKPSIALVILLSVKCVSFPTLSIVSGPVIIVDDITDVPLT